ncbi:cupin domain-containing protein [Halobium palmae]|uniref:Cupin domain-containing protein n=1 Tax=Halobium palmae TaxID=1776492 RepID=A0ABD5RZY2_9EURY
MERVSAADVEEDSFAGVTVSRLSDPLGTEDLAINHYRLAPGESFSAGMHTHLDQEEVFYVVEGTATFETEAGEVDVAAGEAVRFAPGDYQTGRNDAENGDRVHVRQSTQAPSSM